MNEVIVPADMPPGVREMLSATIGEAWEEFVANAYNPNDPEAFWAFLTSEG